MSPARGTGFKPNTTRATHARNNIEEQRSNWAANRPYRGFGGFLPSLGGLRAAYQLVRPHRLSPPIDHSMNTLAEPKSFASCKTVNTNLYEWPS